MRSLLRASSASLAVLLLAGCATMGKAPKPVLLTSGICAWVKEHHVQAKTTDDPVTKKKSADQISWYNKNC